MKRVMIGAKPTGQAPRPTADDWVSTREAGEPSKRLTFDIPLSLHKRVKSQCALQSQNMADVLRGILEHHFSEKGEGRGFGDPGGPAPT